MDILLIAGMWLDGSAWKDVVPELEARGHHPIPLTLPGQGREPEDARLEDQLAAVTEAMGTTGRVMLVGHSAASTLAWMAAAAAPDRVAKVVMIGGFPTSGDSPYFDAFEPEDRSLPFPGWDHFEGPDSADLDDEAKRRIEAQMIPVAERVIRGTVRYRSERRFEVPLAVVCPEFSCAQAQEWIDSGEIPELARVKHLELLDIDSGHWPMFSKPAALAALLDDAAPQD